MNILVKKTVVALSLLSLFISPLALAQDNDSTENNLNQPSEVAFPSQQQANTNPSNALVTMSWANILNTTASLTQDSFSSTSGLASISSNQLGANMSSPFIMAFNQEATANAGTHTLVSTFTTTQITMAVGAVFNPTQHPADVAGSLFSLGAPPPNLSFLASAVDIQHPITNANFAGLPTQSNFVTGFNFSNVALDASAMQYVGQHASSLSVHGTPIPSGSLAHAGVMLSLSADSVAISQLTSEDYKHQATHTFAYNLPKAGILRILPYLPSNAHRMINSPDMSVQEARTLLNKYPNLMFNLRSFKNNRPFFLWRNPNLGRIHETWANLPNNMITVNGFTFHKRYATMNASRLARTYDMINNAIPGTDKALAATVLKGTSMFASSTLPNKMLILRNQQSVDFAAHWVKNVPAFFGNLNIFIGHGSPIDGKLLFSILADKLSPSSTSNLITPAGVNMNTLQSTYKAFFARGQISQYSLPNFRFKKDQINIMDQRLLMGNTDNKQSDYPQLQYKQTMTSPNSPSLPTLEKPRPPGY